MRLPFIIALVFLSALPAFSQQKLVINGTVEGDLNGFRKIYFTDYNFLDSVEVVDNHFSYTFTLPAATLIYAYTEYHNKSKNIFALTPILADKGGAVSIHYNLENYRAKITGNGTAPEFLTISNDWNKLPAGERGTATPAQEAFLFNLVKTNAAAYSTAYFLDQNTQRFPPSLQEKLYAGLSVKAKATNAGIRFGDRLDGYRNSGKGKKVIPFSLKDSAGKTHSIRDYEGKFVVIDFWASWCGPCRASFPHLKSLYTQYHSKGLEIISISIDEKKNYWLTAVQEEKLPWLQLLDDQHLNNKGFGVTAIPHLFLLDKEGKFIFQQLGSSGGEESPLEKKLKEIFGEVTAQN